MNEWKNKYIFYSSSSYMPHSSVGLLYATLEMSRSEHNRTKYRNQSKNSTIAH